MTRPLFFVALLLASGCGASGRLEIPKAPSMAAVHDALANPTASLRTETVQQMATGLDVYFQVTGALQACAGAGTCDEPGLVDRLVGSIKSEQPAEKLRRAVTVEHQRQALTVNQVELSGRGYLEVAVVCPGWDGSTVPDPATNGRILLTATFDDGGVTPVLWGEARRCRWTQNAVTINGSLQLDIGDRFRQGGTDTAVLFRLVGAVTTAAQSWEGDLRIYVGEDGQTEIQVPIDDEHLVFSVGPQGPAIRAANGTWLCDVDMADLGTGLCRLDDEEVRW